MLLNHSVFQNKTMLLLKNEEFDYRKQDTTYILTWLLFLTLSGASSTDSDGESLTFKSKPGAMPQ